VKLLATLKNVPGEKVDLLVEGNKFILERVHRGGAQIIHLDSLEFIELLVAGLKFYEINGGAVTNALLHMQAKIQ